MQFKSNLFTTPFIYLSVICNLIFIGYVTIFLTTFLVFNLKCVIPKNLHLTMLCDFYLFFSFFFFQMRLNTSTVEVKRRRKSET